MIIHHLLSWFFRKLNWLLSFLGSYVEERQKLRDGTIKEHYGPRFSIRWQNLNEDAKYKPKGVPYHGRCWLWIRGFSKHGNNIEFSWHLWQPRWLYSFHFEVKDGDNDLHIAFGLWPFSFHLSIGHVFSDKFNAWWKKKYGYSGREIWYYSTISDASTGGVNFVGHFWRDGNGGSSKKSWRNFYIDFPDIILTPLFGKLEYTKETLETRPLTVPLPEGSYNIIGKLERSIWKRKRLPWNSIVRHGAWADIEFGIPYEGKGENSWDCGEDGVYGMGCNEPSFPALVGAITEHVLKMRQKRSGNMYREYPPPTERETKLRAIREENEKKRLEGRDDGAGNLVPA